jgi:hypothetical protein
MMMRMRPLDPRYAGKYPLLDTALQNRYMAVAYKEKSRGWTISIADLNRREVTVDNFWVEMPTHFLAEEGIQTRTSLREKFPQLAEEFELEILSTGERIPLDVWIDEGDPYKLRLNLRLSPDRDLNQFRLVRKERPEADFHLRAQRDIGIRTLFQSHQHERAGHSLKLLRNNVLGLRRTKSAA